MKKLFRHPVVQRMLAATLSGYLKLVYATLRWTREGEEGARAVWAQRGETGAILCFWHGRIPLSPCSWEAKNGGQEMRALISRSADGEFIALTMEALGFPAIRGSRRNANAVTDKGGAEAFRDMVRWIKGGGAVAVTPDGPKGPAQVMGEGVPSVARVTAAPVLLVGIACKPCLRARSWDHTVLPLPFARSAMVWAGPLYAPREADPVQLAEDWGAQLTAVTDRAEAMIR